jgi:hypothetical protein
LLRIHRPLVVGTLLSALAGAAGAQTLPIASAGPDQSLPCAPPSGAEVTLDGSASSDPDDPLAVLTYTWSGDAALGVGVTLEGPMPVVTLAPGVHVLTLSVDDGVDGSHTDDVQITVVADAEPPQLVLGTTEAELWPPNHKLHTFLAADLVQSASDACDTGLDAADVVFVRGTSDEADDGKGDGNTSGDLSFAMGCAAAAVRAERAGPEDGRVYELVLAAQDAAGNAAEAVFTVSVPHDRAHAPIDSGDAFEVLAAECGPVELCPEAPSESCDDGGAASVSLRGDGKHAPSLRWRAKGFAAGAAEFSDPETDYQLCVYVDDGVAAVLEDDPAAPHGPGWKHHKNGASFKGRKGGPNAGLARLKLATKRGAGSLSLAAGGEEVSLPALPIAAGSSLRLELHDSEGDCVGSLFDDPEVNDGDRFADEDGEE